MIYNWPPREKFDRDLRRTLASTASSQPHLITLTPNRARSILGKTVDFAILDLGRQLYPNDLGIIIETVRGGGLVVLRLPSEDQWRTVRTYKHDNLKSSISNIDYEPRFLCWLVETLKASGHCHFIDLRKQEHSSSNHLQGIASQPSQSLVDNSACFQIFPSELLKMVKTQDQVKGLMAADKLIQSQESSKKNLLVILANRGRGKSATLGMIAAGYLFWARNTLKEHIRVIISAPFLGNAQEALIFAMEGLSTLGVELEVQKDQRGNVTALRFSEGTIEFLLPTFCGAETQHLLLIDEAGGIPPALLKTMIKKSHITVLSSTVHGYEGVGRTFNNKFLSRIRKQPHYALHKITMNTPIRFPKDDPVEKWLFRALLLDAEPSQLNRERVLKKDSELSFVRLSKEHLFSLSSEKTLRSVFGLFVHSHYRNQPNDVSIAADAPNYDIYVLGLKEHQKMPLVAILGCWEGNFDEQTIALLDKHPDTQGHIIPLTFLRYHDKNFAKLKGIRIVRIATHPDRQSEGLGGYALESLTTSATQAGADWVGSSFGATTQLVRFWTASGFQPIHIRPTSSPITGEYSLVVAKGISLNGQQAVERANADFLIRFSGLLQSLYKKLDTELAQELLKSSSRISDFSTRLTQSMRLRVWRYCWGQLYPIVAMEALRELAIWYFLRRPSVRLSRAQELILISRILQVQTWGKSMIKTHQAWINAQGLLKKAMKKLLKTYEKQLPDFHHN